MIERPEFSLLEKNGYYFNDPFDVVNIFEKKISDYTGATYVTVTDCCTHSLELCLRYRLLKGEKITNIKIPTRTYLSIPMLLQKLNLKYNWNTDPWTGYYYLQPTNIVDMAIRFTKDCYIPGTDSCLSFGNKKVLKVYRGGAILTDDKKAHEYYQKARSDGRDFNFRPWQTQPNFNVLGFHYNLSCEDCARGILLMDDMAKQGSANPDAMNDCASYYPDLSKLNLTF
jgi:hypothetical protein